MTPTHPDTEILADPKLPVIRIAREFDAPPTRVFHCHADPELYARWCGPNELTTTIDQWDFRTGGSWRFHQSVGDEAFAFYGSFHEVRPGELIVQTFTFAGYPDGVSLERLVFIDLGGGRTRLESVSLVDSFEARDAMISSGMEVGVNQGYDKLDTLLEATAERA